LAVVALPELLCLRHRLPLGHLVSIPVCLPGLPLCFLEPSLLLRLVLLQVRPAPVAAPRCLAPLESTPVHSRNCVPVVIFEPAFVGPRTGADRQQIFEGNRRGSGSSRLVRCDRASHAGSSCHRWQSGGATSSKRIGSSGPGTEAPECTLSLRASGANFRRLFDSCRRSMAINNSTIVQFQAELATISPYSQRFAHVWWHIHKGTCMVAYPQRHMYGGMSTCACVNSNSYWYKRTCLCVHISSDVPKADRTIPRCPHSAQQKSHACSTPWARGANCLHTHSRCACS